MALAAPFYPSQSIFGPATAGTTLSAAGADWGLGTYFGADLVLIGVTSLPEDCEIWRLQIL